LNSVFPASLGYLFGEGLGGKTEEINMSKKLLSEKASLFGRRDGRFSGATIGESYLILSYPDPHLNYVSGSNIYDETVPVDIPYWCHLRIDS
jgi:hypothetical protein